MLGVAVFTPFPQPIGLRSVGLKRNGGDPALSHNCGKLS